MTPRGTSSASQMRQHVTACDTRTHFRQPAKPLTFPKTGNAHNGASRRVDVVIDPYGALRGAYFAVGAAIGRPRNDPPNMERADANSYPVGLRICIGVLYFFGFHRGRPMAAPTRGYVPGLAGMLVQMYGRTELF